MDEIEKLSAEAADDFDRYLSNGVPDYYIVSEEDKASLKDIIKAAIEKWDESRRIQLSDYANEILRLQKELSRAAHASGFKGSVETVMPVHDDSEQERENIGELEKSQGYTEISESESRAAHASEDEYEKGYAGGWEACDREAAAALQTIDEALSRLSRVLLFLRMKSAKPGQNESET